MTKSCGICRARIDQGRFFEVISVDSATLTLTAHSGVSYSHFPALVGIQIGNFDHQKQDPATKGTEPDPTATEPSCTATPLTPLS